MAGKGSLYYPFAAIVNQSHLKKALLLNAVSPSIGGVLIRGTSGTAKSTAVRGLAQLLPEIETVAGCPFRCDPKDTANLCEQCQSRMLQGETLPIAKQQRTLINLPLNATEDRVAGSLDISCALKEGIKALEPGLLADANRGILYIDEINLLDDHIVDILLDAAALGINIVEREGVSVAHPSRFLLIGTMNPEEGELRPQISDRIGLQVEVEGIMDIEGRVEVMKRRDKFLRDPEGFVAWYLPEQENLRHAIAQAMEILPRVFLSDFFYEAIARLTRHFQVDSHRADITVAQCAKTLAALDGREVVSPTDILDAAQLALGHRVPTDPFEPGPPLERRDLQRQLEKILDKDIGIDGEKKTIK